MRVGEARTGAACCAGPRLAAPSKAVPLPLTARAGCICFVLLEHPDSELALVRSRGRLTVVAAGRTLQHELQAGEHSSSARRPLAQVSLRADLVTALIELEKKAERRSREVGAQRANAESETGARGGGGGHLASRWRERAGEDSRTSLLHQPRTSADRTREAASRCRVRASLITRLDGQLLLPSRLPVSLARLAPAQSDSELQPPRPPFIQPVEPRRPSEPSFVSLRPRLISSHLSPSRRTIPRPRCPVPPLAGSRTRQRARSSFTGRP